MKQRGGARDGGGQRWGFRIRTLQKLAMSVDWLRSRLCLRRLDPQGVASAGGVKRPPQWGRVWWGGLSV